MIQRFLVFLLILGCVACGTDTNDNLKITGTIDGLKEGTLYLQKLSDTTLVTLDSVVVNGDPNFVFSTTIDEPEILYLYLDKKDFNDLNDRIDFFAEPGEMTIQTSLRRFVNDVSIKGSANQELLKEFKSYITKFNTKELSLLKDAIEAQAAEDSERLQEINQTIANNNKSRMRYILNYSFKNNEKEVAPYVVTVETPDANVRYLDTIYKQLPQKIADSKYGKKLKTLVEARKAEQSE